MAGLVATLKETSRLGAQSIGMVARLRIPWRESLSLAYEAGNRSFLFVAVTMAFIGMIAVYQTASQMARVIPEFSALGAGCIQMTVKEMGPIMAGLLLGIRVGTGYAAELGTMKVSDQLDALRLCSVDPVQLLVVPRLLATLLATFSLTVLGSLVGLAAGMGIAYSGFSVLPDTFINWRFVGMSDLHMGLTKCAAFGLSVPLISCACGFQAEGGAEGVGKATTQAVVYCSFAVILLDAIISTIWELAA